MSTSSTAVATRADDNDEEINEVVEEEIEEEEVDDLPGSPNDVAEDRKDFSKETEPEGHRNDLQSGSYTQEKSKAREPSDALDVVERRGNFKIVGSSNEPYTRPKEFSHENLKKSKYLKSGKQLTSVVDNEGQESGISKKDVGAFPRVKTHEEQNKQHTDGEVHFCSTEIMDSETSSPFSVSRKIVTGGIQIRGRLGEGIFEEEIKQMGLHLGDNKQGMASRFVSAAIRTRSLSPGAETKDGNKRPAVICDFFTKGWCIKGNSCRFLHVKDDASTNAQLPEEDMAAATVKTEVQSDEGSRNETDRSKMPCFPDPLASSIRNHVSFSSDLSSERILPLEPGECKRLPEFQENHRLSFLQKENTSLDNSPSSQQLPSFRDDMGSISSSKYVGRESLRNKWPADDYGNCTSLTSRASSPIFRNNLLPEHRSSSSGSAILSSNYHSRNPSSYPSSLEERPWIRSKYMHNDYSSAVISHSLNSSLGTAGPTASNFSSRQIAAWTGSALPYSSSSLNACPLDAQALLDSSQFSVSESEKPGFSADYKAKISSNDWEPSVPFRPSFFIAPTSISSPGSQYDPFRDSFDSPKMGDVSLKVAFSSVGVSGVNMSDQQPNGDLMLSETMAPECNGDKSSISSHSRFSEIVLDKNCDTPTKDSYSYREEGVGTSSVDGHGAMPKQDDPSVTTCVKDISKSKKISTNCNSTRQSGGCRHDKELKIDRVRQRNEMDLEHRTDGDVRKESKAMKHFRIGLVDFVKELLKPTWREGLLSKDVHNTIVKKAVDKVLNTLRLRQIPTTKESIKQYLSLSQPKIAKLVEGYVDKYGKS